MFNMMKGRRNGHRMLFWLGAMGGLAAIASGVWAIVRAMRDDRGFEMQYTEDEAMPTIT